MSRPSSTVHAGVALADSRLERERDEFLRERTSRFYGVIVAMAGGIYLVVGVLIGFTRGWTAEIVFAPSRLVHLGGVAAVFAAWTRLGRASLREPALRAYDAFALIVAIATALIVYGMQYRDGIQTIPGILALFVVARAVFVPCTGKVTFLMSLPAPLGLLAIQLAHARLYAEPGVTYSRSTYVQLVVLDQVVLFLGVGIATYAAHLGDRMRSEIARAQRLGQYHLDELLGRGSMGEVYRATHAMLRRPTAIKLVQSERTAEETLKRFEREVRETSRLAHPNTIRIFDYGRTPEGVFYYAMELLDGANLREIVERDGTMPPGRVIHILRQACAALREAHALGLVHRDIKPGNLMLCCRGGEYDVVKVVDFGLVKDLRDADSSVTQLGTVCGTPQTIAPEVIHGRPAGPVADLYALGVVGYYLLVGVPVFDAKTPLEFINHHLNSEPPPLAERDPSIPGDLAEVLMRCLRKEPEGRYADAGGLRAALDGCADARAWSDADAAAWWRGFVVN